MRLNSQCFPTHGKRSQHNILLKIISKSFQLGDSYEPFVTVSQSCCSQTKMDGIDEQIKLNEILPLMKNS